MGVPTFFRWLTTRYPKVVRDAIERQSKEIDGRAVPVDIDENPPNGDYDNLYLDMNALIHPCCHPEDGPPPVDEEHMFELIFCFVDRLIRIIRPKKLLYMAVDGVAPRAKMNQQRARRFRAAQERREAKEELEKLHVEWDKEGRCLPKKHHIKEPFDSNVITPGTPFMHRLSEAFKYYIHDRANNDPLWQKFKFQVIFSDCQQPGEGEHKIMEFIRSQRAQPEYDPNTRHMLYGADADLIVLGLALHETHFHIIREVIIPKQDTKCTMCGSSGHVASECLGTFTDFADDDDDEFAFENKPLQIVSLPVLRQYLGVQFGGPLQETLPFPFDFERIVDDFVFFCFFVGNDFLPHLPSLHIREGSIDQMITLYIELLPGLGGYLTDAGFLNLEICEKFMEYLGGIEDQVFKNRLQKDKDRKEYINKTRPTEKTENPEEGPEKKRQKFVVEEVVPEPEKSEPASKDMGLAWHATLLADSFACDDLPDEDDGVEEIKGATVTSSAQAKLEPKEEPNETAGAEDDDDENALEIEDDTAPLRPVLPRMPVPVKDEPETTNNKKRALAEKAKASLKTFHETIRARLDERRDLGPQEDTVRLGEGAAWKQRYYFDKFGLKQEDLVEFLQAIRKSYVEGLCWVLAYYYQGCPSWTWFYPYHYAPFASDLIGMDSLDCHNPGYFTLSKPFTPYQQLMSVLPPDSAERAGLPKSLHNLMTDEKSPIVDFYPSDFALDINGKRFTWQAVVLLPFIDEPRLIEALAPHLGNLEGDHFRRNKLSHSCLYGLKDHHLGKALADVPVEDDLDVIPATSSTEGALPLRFIYVPLGFAKGKVLNANVKSPFEGLPDVEESDCVVTVFQNPENKPHKSELLEGAGFEPMVVTEQDEAHMRWLKGFGGEHARRMILEALGKDWKVQKWGANHRYGQRKTYIKGNNRFACEDKPTDYRNW